MAEGKQCEPEMTIEEILSSLDEHVKNLESEEISLEASFHVYEEGMQLIKKANDKIDMVEKKVMQLSEDNTLSEFAGMEEANGF